MPRDVWKSPCFLGERGIHTSLVSSKFKFLSVSMSDIRRHNSNALIFLFDLPHGCYRDPLPLPRTWKRCMSVCNSSVVVNVFVHVPVGINPPHEALPSCTQQYIRTSYPTCRGSPARLERL